MRIPYLLLLVLVRMEMEGIHPSRLDLIVANKIRLRSRGPRDDDTCPIHDTHPWKYCIYNKNGPNYRPPARDANDSGRRSRNERSHGSGDQHHNDRGGSHQYSDYERGSSNGRQENPQGGHHHHHDRSSEENNPYADDFKETGVSDDPVPQVIVEAREVKVERLLSFEQCLLDSGGSRSLIARSRIPNGVAIHTLSNR